ncbi:hypothetical protein BKA81DRAFT_383346 [Phyllosticta paracitricarpa]
MCGLAVAGLSQDAGAEEQRISEGKERHRAQRRVCIASAVVPVNSAVACGSEAAVLGKKNGDERARVEARIEAAVRGGVVEVELLRSSGQGPREGGVAGRGRWRIRRDAAGGMDGISPAKQRLAIFHHPLHNFLRPPPLTQFSVHTGMTRCLLLKSLSPANPLAAEKWKCFSRGVFTDSRLFSHLNHSVWKGTEYFGRGAGSPPLSSVGYCGASPAILSLNECQVMNTQAEAKGQKSQSMVLGQTFLKSRRSRLVNWQWSTINGLFADLSGTDVDRKRCDGRAALNVGDWRRGPGVVSSIGPLAAAPIVSQGGRGDSHGHDGLTRDTSTLPVPFTCPYLAHGYKGKHRAVDPVAALSFKVVEPMRYLV